MALDEITALDQADVRSSLFAWGFAVNYGIVVGNPQPHPITERLAATIPLSDCFRAMGRLIPGAKAGFENSTDYKREYALGVEYSGGKVSVEFHKDEPLIKGWLVVDDGQRKQVVLSFDVKSDIDQVKGYIGHRGTLLPITCPPRSTD